MQTTTSPATVSGILKAITYDVPSSSRPGITYVVALNPFTLRPMSCNCPARVVCKHQKAIAAGQLPGKAHVRYGPKVVMTPAMQRATELYA